MTWQDCLYLTDIRQDKTKQITKNTLVARICKKHNRTITKL